MDAVLSPNMMSPFHGYLPSVPEGKPLVPVGNVGDLLLHSIPFLSKAAEQNSRVVYIPDAADESAGLGVFVSQRKAEKIVQEYQRRFSRQDKHNPSLLNEFARYIKDPRAQTNLLIPEEAFIASDLLPRNQKEWPEILAVLRRAFQEESEGSGKWRVQNFMSPERGASKHPSLGQKRTDPDLASWEFNSLVFHSFKDSRDVMQIVRCSEAVRKLCDQNDLKRHNGDPEWIHSNFVGSLLIFFGSRNVPLVLSGLLHDVCENTKRYSELSPGAPGWEAEVRRGIILHCREFGCTVDNARKTAELVIGYTKRKIADGEALTPQRSQDIYLDQLTTFLHMVGKCADIIHNRLTQDTVGFDKTNEHYRETVLFYKKFKRMLRDLQSFWNRLDQSVDHRDYVAGQRLLTFLKDLMPQVASLQRERNESGVVSLTPQYA